MEINKLQDIAAQVRRDIIRMVHGAKSGHPGGSLGCADFLTALYFDVMEIDPEHFTREGNGEDMFFLSNGHISPVLYSVMARRGYFPVSELATFRKLGTRLQGHPTPVEGLPGIRVASGSLGQGLSASVRTSICWLVRSPFLQPFWPCRTTVASLIPCTAMAVPMNPLASRCISIPPFLPCPV